MSLSLAELEAALDKAAIAVGHDARLLPIYQRVERELEAKRAENDALQRALQHATNGGK